MRCGERWWMRRRDGSERGSLPEHEKSRRSAMDEGSANGLLRVLAEMEGVSKIPSLDMEQGASRGLRHAG